MTTWVANPRVLLRRLPDGIVALPASPSAHDDDTTLLSGTAEELWDLLSGPRGLDELAGLLADRHGADPAVVAADLAPALDSLVRRGLVTTSTGGSPR